MEKIKNVDELNLYFKDFITRGYSTKTQIILATPTLDGFSLLKELNSEIQIVPTQLILKMSVVASAFIHELNNIKIVCSKISAEYKKYIPLYYGCIKSLYNGYPRYILIEEYIEGITLKEFIKNISLNMTMSNFECFIDSTRVFIANLLLLLIEFRNLNLSNINR